MSRFLLSIAILFLVSSCMTGDFFNQDDNPEEKIIDHTVIEDNNLNIALLAPIGKQKEYVGMSLLQSAQLAIEDAKNPNINLIPMDSDLITANPEFLVNQMLDKKVKVVLGPLYGSDTEKLVPLLREKDITILSFSNDSSIQGDSLLTLGVSPRNQSNILASYAIGKGIKHFYLLLPSNKYGKLVENAIEEVIADKDGTSYTVSWYTPANDEQIIDDLVRKIKRNNYYNNKDTAIFMPQAGSSLDKLDKALTKTELNVTLIGGQSWDTPSVLKYKSFDGAILLRKNMSFDKFRNKYVNIFSNEPTNIDFITYNGVMMLDKMYNNKFPINKQSIIDNNKIYKKDINVTFDHRGYSMYNISILEIHNRNFQKMEYYP